MRPKLKTRSRDGTRRGGNNIVFKPELVELARNYCKLGATHEQLGEFFGVSHSTISAWQSKYPDFNEAVQLGKRPATRRVELSLYKRCMGYEYASEKVFMDRNGNIVRAPIVVHVPPDSAALMFFLKNRAPEKWRDVSKTLVGLDPDAIRHLERTMTQEEMRNHFLDTMRSLPNYSDDEGEEPLLIEGKAIEAELVEAGDAKGEQPADAAPPRSAKPAKRVKP
jgi:hypothetical protein